MNIGKILDDNFSNLLYEIATYFQINEANDFESLEPGDVNLESHDYLKYIDLIVALDGYVVIDFNIADRLFKIDKYKNHIKTNHGSDEIDLENPQQYIPLINLSYCNDVFDMEQEHCREWKFILSKYE